MATGSSLMFPRLDAGVRASWAPIYLSPIMGSPERLVVAVVAVSGAGFHIEGANALQRLRCLYEHSAETAIFATQIALEELRGALSSSGAVALKEGVFVFSGISIGPVAEGEARTLRDLARTWMGALSSLYSLDQVDVQEEAISDLEKSAVSIPDRLPVLVLDHVKARSPDLEAYFSEEIRFQRRRRIHSRIAGVSIDYSGSKFVANFSTLNSSAHASSVDRIKRKMFDLKVRRDEDTGLFSPREHEMIIYTPPRNSPLINDKQAERLDEALEELTDQSRREGFAFQAMHEVGDIGRRLLQAEAVPAYTYMS